MSQLIKTHWFDDIDRECPFKNDYPRPQLRRENWQCLNGQYDYAFTCENSAVPEKWEGKILVPFAPECQLSGVERHLEADKRMWYRRFFTLGDEFKGKRTLLNFGAVDWQCEVFVNSVCVGKHTGGYVPFSLDITDALKDGENELVVRGKQTHSSHGFWYTPTSGIWQTVWLEPVSECYIKSLRLVPDIDKGVVKLEVVRASCECDGKLYAKVLDGDKTVFDGEISANCEIPVPDAKLWSPENPFLYDLTVTLDCGCCKDEVSSYFGMRKFGIAEDEKGLLRLTLNNKPYFQRGLLDQGYWPDGGMSAPCDEALVFDIQKMKDLGFNMLRKHIKVEPLRWYYHCDRIGMIVWQDMVSGGEYIGDFLAGVLPFFSIHARDNMYKAFSREKVEWREDFKRELFEVIDNLYNCVSIGCWVPFNEGWGQFDAKEIGEKVKAYDPSRIVDHASGWHDQKGPDLKSIHRYVVPVVKPLKFGGRPFVISEYGGYSWNIDNHVWKKDKSFGYIMFKNSEGLSKGYKRLHEQQIIPLIKKGLCATVYTQVSDVEFEVNGIYSYDRKVLKLDAQMLRDVNSKMVL